MSPNLNLCSTINIFIIGAVYKAADLTAGFKVKRFLVKDLNLFPIDVSIVLFLLLGQVVFVIF